MPIYRWILAFQQVDLQICFRTEDLWVSVGANLFWRGGSESSGGGNIRER